MATVLGLHDLFSGVMYKCGGKVKSWNKRFFILKSDYCLYYYKDTSKGALGTISLHDPKFKVRKGEAGDISWPKGSKTDCRMAVVTTLRTYFMYCDYSHEIDDWLEMLTKAAKKAAEKYGTSNKLLGAERSASTSQVTRKQEEKEEEPRETSPRPLSTNDVEPLNYEECVMSANNNEAPPPSDQIEAVYALATEVQDVNVDTPSPNLGEYVEVTVPTPEGSKLEESVMYEDVAAADTSPQDIYEAVPNETNYVRPLERPDGQAPPLLDRNDVPPLPDRNDVPPLPDRNDVSPLPDRNDIPPLPDRNEVPPLPDRNNGPPLPDRNDGPPLPDRNDGLPMPDSSDFSLPDSKKALDSNRVEAPLLPDKEDVPPLPDKEDVPPLPDKEDVPSLPDEDVPPLPDKEDIPPLPDKDVLLLPDKEDILPLPDKEDVSPLPGKRDVLLLPDKDVPPLPEKEDIPPLPDKEDVPPLPDKEDVPPEKFSPVPDQDEVGPLVPVRKQSLQNVIPPLFVEEEKDTPASSHTYDVVMDLPPTPPPKSSPQSSPKLSPRSAPHDSPLTTKKEAAQISPQLSPRHSPQPSPRYSPQPTPRRSPRHSPEASRRPVPTSQRSEVTGQVDSEEDSTQPTTATKQQLEGGDPLPNTRPSSDVPVPRPRKNTNPSSVPRAKPRAYTEYVPRETRGHLSEEGETQGQQMFLKRKERLEEVDSTNKKKETLKSALENIKGDPTVTTAQTVNIAETLREVEQERQMASEERFRWERERKKLEEERLKFEEEMRRMKEEMVKMQQQQQ